MFMNEPKINGGLYITQNCMMYLLLKCDNYIKSKNIPKTRRDLVMWRVLRRFCALKTIAVYISTRKNSCQKLDSRLKSFNHVHL